MKRYLKEIGLNEKEAEVYLAILELGQANVIDVSKKSGVPRATVYLILDKLIINDLIGYIFHGKRCYYFAENPEKIVEKIKEKQKKVQELLPELKLIYQKSARRPLIHQFEGVNGIEKMLDDILLTLPKNSAYDVILNVKDEKPLLGREFDNFIKRRVKRNISIRVIIEKSVFTKNWPKYDKASLRYVKYLPKGQHFSVSYHIYGDKVSMFSLQGPITGVLIEDREIAHMEKMQFEYMWQGLK